jgi:hypothetical protein
VSALVSHGGGVVSLTCTCNALFIYCHDIIATYHIGKVPVKQKLESVLYNSLSFVGKAASKLAAFTIQE